MTRAQENNSTIENVVAITGGAGFLGSNLAEQLLSKGHRVIIFDNFSTGKQRFLDTIRDDRNLQVVAGDILDQEKLETTFQNVGIVFHFAANADIRRGVENTYRDLEQNTIGTYNVLEACRRSGVKRIAFASSSAAIGEPNVFPTPEDCPAPIQTSLYGASKQAGEGLLSAFANAFGIESYAFRFVSLVGPRYPHGHIFDFCKQLINNPNQLSVLGDGTQRKSFLHVNDCISAILTVLDRRTAASRSTKFEVYNLGHSDFITINQSIQWICESMSILPHITFTGGDRGWIGDSPFVFLDNSKVKQTGWYPKIPIDAAIKETVQWLLQNTWIFESK